MKYELGIIDKSQRHFNVSIDDMLRFLDQSLDKTLPDTGRKIYLNAFRLAMELDITVDPYQLRGFIVDRDGSGYNIFGVYNNHETRKILPHSSFNENDVLQGASELSEMIQVPIGDEVEDFD